MAYSQPAMNPAAKSLMHDKMGIPKGKKIGIAALMKKPAACK